MATITKEQAKKYVTIIYRLIRDIEGEVKLILHSVKKMDNNRYYIQFEVEQTGVNSAVVIHADDRNESINTFFRAFNKALEFTNQRNNK